MKTPQRPTEKMLAATILLSDVQTELQTYQAALFEILSICGTSEAYTKAAQAYHVAYRAIYGEGA